jgi:hypothetical protein
MLVARFFISRFRREIPYKRYHHGVSHTSPKEPAVQGNSDKPRAYARWQTLAALVIAVVAAGVAVAAWFRPTHEGPSYPQSGDAKTNLCAAYKVVHQAVVTNTHLANPGGNAPGGHLAVAANARLALLGGGAYLRDIIGAQTAPPADLAKAVDSLAATIEQLGVNYLANVSNDVQVPLRHDLESEIATLKKLCD